MTLLISLCGMVIACGQESLIGISEEITTLVLVLDDLVSLQQIPVGTQIQIELRPSDGSLQQQNVLVAGSTGLSVVFEGIPAGAATLQCLTTSPDGIETVGSVLAITIQPGSNRFRLDCVIADPLPSPSPTPVPSPSPTPIPSPSPTPVPSPSPTPIPSPSPTPVP
ncbi:MAG: hypothetical protein HC924_09255, partial [Synechococcaceae cyanobacterium SM2_3_2]|nr:hypothetical protein [Synechococcaceae cyanobacterium SM2_3_2]